MKKAGLLFMIMIFTVSCSQVLITGRKQLVLVSDAELLNMSLQSYKQFIDSVPLSKDVVHTAMVKKTGTKIATAVESFLKANGHEAEIANFQWEFNLLPD